MYRFASSATNDMRISDLRIALLNYICAKQANEPFIVRIEGKDQDILEMLALFGMTYSHLYYQSDNFKYHLQFASTLLDKKKAFICFCPENKTSPYNGACENLRSEDVLNNPNPFVIRMKTKPIRDSFVIMKANKYPTRVFGAACDDMLQGVSTIIQDEMFFLDAPQEELIRSAIGYEQKIAYTHVPRLQNDEESVKSLLDQGFLPEALINYLLLLGNQTPYEIFTLEEAVAWFDIKKPSTIPVVFDKKKFCAINVEHIKKLPDMELSKRIGYACENIGKLAKLYTEEASTTYEIKQKVDTLFAKKEFYAEFENESKLLQELILKAPYFETFDGFKEYLSEKSNLQGDLLFKPLRFWLTGSDHSPELALLYPLIKNYLKEIVR